MPRKAKEKIDEIEKKDEKKSVEKKPTSNKKVSVKKNNSKSSKETNVKETPVKKTSSRKSTLAKLIESVADETIKESKSTVVKKAPAKKTSSKKVVTEKASAKKTTSKKAVAEKAPAKKTSSKKAVAEKTSAKKTTSKKATPKKNSTKKLTTKKNDSKKAVQILEYYDLPYKYGNTVVKLLAQTPKTLFVYWEVSDEDIENFKKIYGDDFFAKTKPVLIVHNLTLNKTSEIEINDFANCWYLNTDDTDCKFDIELARKFVDNSLDDSEDNSDYLYLAESNNLQSPNNHILFEKIQEFVVFRNANTDNVIKKNIKSFKFLKDIYKFYKDMYDEEVLNNPSSQFKF